MSNAEFIPGLIVKAPNDKAPDYVKAKLSIKRAELLEFLRSTDDEWINADIKVSQQGKWYAQRDNWRPESKAQKRQEPKRAGGGSHAAADPFDEDLAIPF